MSRKPECTETVKVQDRQDSNDTMKARLLEPQCPNCKDHQLGYDGSNPRLLEPVRRISTGKDDHLAIG
jgi:hypothetical protein